MTPYEQTHYRFQRQRRNDGAQWVSTPAIEGRGLRLVGYFLFATSGFAMLIVIVGFWRMLP